MSQRWLSWRSATEAARLVRAIRIAKPIIIISPTTNRWRSPGSHWAIPPGESIHEERRLWTAAQAEGKRLKELTE
jgi:hypothetical protein